jgi:hypothetical protein
MIAMTLMTIVLAWPPAYGQTLDLVLRDGTTLKEAKVMRLEQGRYMVQTEDALLELTEDDLKPGALAAVDFSKQKAPVLTNHYDELNADGTATRYWTMKIKNRWKKALTEIRMGLAPWELRMVDQRSYVDDHGVTLTSTYDPPREKWSQDSDKVVRHLLHLHTPLAPGETGSFTGSETSTHVIETESGKLYRFVGDYTEDRLLWLKVRLPQWAKIEDVTPAPSAQFEHEGCQYVMWRRYYQKGERFPLEIRYTLE